MTTWENSVPNATSQPDLIGEFFQHFGTALGVGAVILGHDLNRATVDAACVVDHFHSGVRGAAIPTAIGRADAGRMLLKSDLDRSCRLRAGKTCGHRGSGQQAPGSSAFEQCAAVCHQFVCHSNSPCWVKPFLVS